MLKDDILMMLSFVGFTGLEASPTRSTRQNLHVTLKNACAVLENDYAGIKNVYAGLKND